MDTLQNPALPPGPTGRWKTTLQLIRDPKGSFDRWVKAYGDPFFITALNGPVVVTGRPDLIKQIFACDPINYEVFGADSLRPVTGEGSLLVLTGESHRKERKLVMPMFHGDRMRTYANIIQRSAIESMDRRKAGVSFDMLAVTTEISLNVIAGAIFGAEEEQAIAPLVHRSRELVKRSSPLIFFSPKMQFPFFGISPWDRFRKARSELRAAFDAELERRRQNPALREDIMTMLTEARYEDGSPIEPERAYDELGTFLFAGHETSAIAMAWAIYHLYRNQDTLQRLQTELLDAENDRPETLARLPYLKAVVQETLRLHPIITEVLRVLKTPMELDGYCLPAGTALAPCAALAHYRTDTFPEPERFRPARFIERNFSSAEYFPYGGGHRRCAGAAFASYEMAIVLGTIISRYDLTLLEENPVVPKRRNITMGPSTGIRVLRGEKNRK